MEGAAIGLHTESIGITDFYASLWITPKINAALHRAWENLRKAMTPENGFAASCLELCFIKEAREIIRKLIDLQEHNGQVSDIPGQSLIEEDFYLSSSDKIIFAMKEFKADMDPNEMYKRANPLVMSKLDIKVSYLCFITSDYFFCVERPKLQFPKDKHR